MSFFMKNTEFLKEKAPSLYNALTVEEPIYDVKIKEEESNFQMEYKDRMAFSNSIYSESDEFYELLRNVDDNVQALIIYGLGNGHILSEVRRKYNNLELLIIVEPVLEVFRAFAHKYAFNEVFANMGQITFLVNRNSDDASVIISDIFTGHKITNLEIIGLPSYCCLLEEEYASFKERTLRGIRSRLMHLVTLHNSRYMWLRNTIHNMKYLEVTHDVVKDKLKGRPGVIVAAGPSLTKQFPLLPELKEKAVFIAAGSAIKILNSIDINPDVRMVIDGNRDDSIYDDSFFENSSDIPILYASQGYDGILPKYDGYKLFMSLPTDVIGHYMLDKLDISTQEIKSGASVVQSALSFLCEAGCDPIIFVGQDMCFYENALYADGISSISQRDFDERGWIPYKDMYGNDVYTVRNYLQIKYDYESLLKGYDNKTFINATEGGLGIEGTIEMPLQEVMDKYINNSDIDLNLTEYLDGLDKDKFINKKDVKRVLEQTKEELERILEINDKRLKEIKRFTLDREGMKVSISRLKDDFQYLDIEYDKKFKEIELYSKVIIPNISVQSIALKHLYKSNSSDLIENLKEGERYLYGIITETEIFCGVMKEWIEELLIDME